MTKRQIRYPDGPLMRLMAAGALVVASACAAPILAVETTAPVGTVPAAPVSCGIATDSHFGITTFRPWVRLDPVRPGSYHFALTGQGTAIDQGGGFELDQTGQAVLGEATVSGPASGYDAELTVTIDGTLYRCFAAPTEI